MVSIVTRYSLRSGEVEVISESIYAFSRNREVQSSVFRRSVIGNRDVGVARREIFDTRRGIAKNPVNLDEDLSAPDQRDESREQPTYQVILLCNSILARPINKRARQGTDETRLARSTITDTKPDVCACVILDAFVLRRVWNGRL